MAYPTVRDAARPGDPGLPADSRAQVVAPTEDCPVEITLRALGGRWTTLLVRELLRGPHTYTELAAALPALSDKVLTSRLRHLRSEGVVDRRRTPGWPATVSYELTARGRGLGPVLQALWDWGTDGE